MCNLAALTLIKNDNKALTKASCIQEAFDITMHHNTALYSQIKHYKILVRDTQSNLGLHFFSFSLSDSFLLNNISSFLDNGPHGH